MRFHAVFALFGLIVFTHESAADPGGKGNANSVSGTAPSVSSDWWNYYRSDRNPAYSVEPLSNAQLAQSSQWDNFGPSSHVVFDLVGKANAAETDAPSISNEALIDSNAIRLLRQMGKYLGAAREFSFRADITDDVVLSNGQKIQNGGIANVEVRRPNKLHVRYSGDERQTQVFYDGKNFTILDMAKLVYTKTNVPPTIDAAVDKIFDQYGFSVPIADLVYEDPYRILIENVETGFMVGRKLINGRPTFHLAFTQKEIDWQIWIEDGPRPLPRKLLITYKNETGSPQYTAILSGWDFQPRLSEAFAEFHPLSESNEIEFLGPANSRPKTKN